MAADEERIRLEALAEELATREDNESQDYLMSVSKQNTHTRAPIIFKSEILFKYNLLTIISNYFKLPRWTEQYFFIYALIGNSLIKLIMA